MTHLALAHRTTPGPRKVDPAKETVDALIELAEAGDPRVAWDALERCRGALALLGRAPSALDLLRGHAPSAAVEEDSSDVEIVVDLARNTLSIPARGQRAGGRPLLCALLARLTPHEARSPEQLHYEVWGGRDYHALRHRNTIYMGVLRLRRALAALLPGREVVERTTRGWRLGRGISLRVVEDAPRPRAAAL